MGFKKNILYVSVFFFNAMLAEKLIFYHIPKTAGCTTRFLLETQFDYSKVAPEMFYYEIESKRLSDLDKFDLFSGHFFFHSNLQYMDAKRITFLRDPVQRVLSEERFFKKFYKDTQRRQLLAIQHYNPAGDPINVLSNQQVLYLSSLDRNDLTIPIQKHYESAKKNLHEAFDFVGIVEEYENSIRSLYAFMGWEQMELIPILQSADAQLAVDVETIVKIQERNHFDILLYNEAKKLFKEKHFVKNIKSIPPKQFFSELEIDFKNSPYYEGFSSPVFFMEHLYRPIAPSGRAFIKVPLESGADYKILISANKTISDTHFKIVCQGKELPYESSKSKIYCILPKELVTDGEKTKIEFILDNLDAKNMKWDRINESTGIAFKSIQIDCL